MIDYGRLDRSIQFYEAKGFSRVELPWLVTKEISAITKPVEKTNGKLLVRIRFLLPLVSKVSYINTQKDFYQKVNIWV